MVSAPSVYLRSSALSWIRSDCSLRFQNEGMFTQQIPVVLEVTEIRSEYSVIRSDLEFCPVSVILQLLWGAIDFLCFVRIRETVCN